MKKEDTPMRIARRNYEERNKELNSQIQVKENELLKYKG